jgi:hypothetical protein
VFSERMASFAIRRVDEETLRLGLQALLLAWRGPDSRGTLVVFPLFYDAIGKLGVNSELFVSSLRRISGDELISPFTTFLSRPGSSSNLATVGYVEGSDSDGFRYLREW